MSRNWLVLLGVLAFAVTLAVVVGNRLVTTGATVVAFGIAVGVVVGVVAALVVLQVADWHLSGSPRDETTTVIMPREQAETLVKIVSGRRQADPDAFPLVGERGRQITAVGGAHLDAGYDED